MTCISAEMQLCDEEFNNHVSQDQLQCSRSDHPNVTSTCLLRYVDLLTVLFKCTSTKKSYNVLSDMGSVFHFKPETMNRHPVILCMSQEWTMSMFRGTELEETIMN